MHKTGLTSFIQNQSGRYKLYVLHFWRMLFSQISIFLKYENWKYVCTSSKIINEYTAINEYHGKIWTKSKRVWWKQCEYLGKKVMKTKRVYSFIREVRVAFYIAMNILRWFFDISLNGLGEWPKAGILDRDFIRYVPFITSSWFEFPASLNTMEQQMCWA